MIVSEKTLTPIATTSDNKYVYYKKDGDFDGVFILNDTEIKLTLFDFFARRTDITPIEDTPEKRKIWADLRREMGATSPQGDGLAGKAARRPERFDPDAVDADADGRVQDGTPFERPAIQRIVESGSRLLNRSQRRRRKNAVDKQISTDTTDRTFIGRRNDSIKRARSRAKQLNIPARKVFRGRQRGAAQRRQLLEGSSFAEFKGIQRLFKSREDAHSDLKASVIDTLTDMRERALQGSLRGRSNRGMGVATSRPLDPRVVDYFKRRTPEQMWEDLEKASQKLHQEVSEMPIEVRINASLASVIIESGLLGDPKMRVKRADQKVPWVIGLLSERGHTLSDKDREMLREGGLLPDNGAAGRGDVYESMRELLEQAMGFNGATDRSGRPVYGYFVTPSEQKTPEGINQDSLTEIGRRLRDISNGPNLAGYSDSALVRLRDSVHDRSGYTYGDSLRGGVLPRRIGAGDDMDTSLAVIHDRDISGIKDQTIAAELREIQQEYILNLVEWDVTGDSSNLTRWDYVEAVVPYDVTPEEIDEMVVATDKLMLVRDDLDDFSQEILGAAAAAGISGDEYGKLLMLLTEQGNGWASAMRSSGQSSMTDFAGLDTDLRFVLQALKGRKIKEAGENRGINMMVGPSNQSSPANLDAALLRLFRRFQS